MRMKAPFISRDVLCKVVCHLRTRVTDGDSIRVIYDCLARCHASIAVARFPHRIDCILVRNSLRVQTNVSIKSLEPPGLRCR
jgi:hypothetical protein